MESGLIDAVAHKAAIASPEVSPDIAIPPAHRRQTFEALTRGAQAGSTQAGSALAGDWSSVSDQPWQRILDETIVALTWSAGIEELDALIEAVLVCATARQRHLSARTLAEWIRVTLADRDLFQRYVHDLSIPAEQRAALADELDASGRRIDSLVSALEGEPAPAPAVSASACGLALDAPDPASIAMALRAQASIIEHRLNGLLKQIPRSAPL